MSARVALGFYLVVSVLLGNINSAYGASQYCDSDDCEYWSESKIETERRGVSEKEAPYVLRIIKSGETKPRLSNKTQKGRLDNRRTDVTLTRKVPLPTVKNETRRGVFGSGSTVWISKDPTSLDRILEIKAPDSAILSDGALEKPIKFDVKTNYSYFIERLEILIWSEEATQLTEPLKTLSIDRLISEQQYEWDGQLDDISLKPGMRLQYAIRAIDAQGHMDQSVRSILRFVEANAKPTAKVIVSEISVIDEADSSDGSYTKLYLQSIPIQGSKVRLFGQNLKSGSRVTIDKQSVKVDKEGRFGRELLLPDGEHQFDVVVENANGEILKKQLNIDLDPNHFFMVALADVSVGENNVSGSLEPLAADKHLFGGDIFVDGRLAFYLKGKVRGKYLITAQMDTGTEDIEKLFDNFHRKDAQSVFRRIDPDQYYPVYADDSTLVNDTDSQGKLYVRVNWDRSRAIWGNFNTNFTGTEFAPFNRSLYGAQIIHNNTNDTSLGNAKHTVSAFASKAQSLFRHNEFLGTGGSLYYLRDTDIVIGSEKVWVEVRQAGTSRVVQKVALVSGRDYDIDEFQGRIVLRRPLLSVSAWGEPSIIRDEPLAGNQTYLVVDYEYSPPNLDFNDSSVGVRAKKWLYDHLGIGGTWAHESRDSNDYDIKGADITLKRSDQTFIKGEYAQSESSQTSGSYLSTDGGLSFEPFVSNSTQTSGNAFGIEARTALQDFIPHMRPFEFGLWAKRQQAGFSTANTDVGVYTTDFGIEAISQLSDSITLFARATRLDRKAQTIESSVAGQVDYDYSDNITVSGELKGSRDENIVAQAKGQSLIVAGKVSADASERLNVYGTQQATVSHSGTHTSNNASSVGAIYTANDKVHVTGEISKGDKGNSALVGTEVNFSDTYSIYTNYTYSYSKENLNKNALVIGQKKTLSSQLKVYSEHQFSDEDSRTGYAHTVGLDQKITRHASANLSVQKASVENDDGNTIERDSISVGLEYKKDRVRINSKLEHRSDESTELDTHQWVTTNRFEYRKSPSFHWQGKLNASKSNDRLSDNNARFIEAGIGFAFRPVKSDRLNMLTRLTFLDDLQPRSQSTQSDQRSLIGSIEGLYDITRLWSTGAKLAHRTSEIRLQRNEGQWLNNDASLVSARVRYKTIFGVDATSAYHWLYSGASKGDRHGALFTVGKRVGMHLTFSVGYNFSSFDDNLANDNYDVRGWFVNLIGTY